MNMKQAGFTLIELVMVIVILGILAAVAVPKFVDLSSEAKLAATQGVAGAVSSAFAVNYAVVSANSTKGFRLTSATLDLTAAVGSVLQGGIPAGYTASAAATSVNCGTPGSAIQISITSGAGGTSAPATLICTA